MCTKILLKDSKIPTVEFGALLSGPKVLDRSSQRKNPDPDWISVTLWDSVCELDNLDAFEGLHHLLKQKCQPGKHFLWTPRQKHWIFLEWQAE